MDLIDRQAAIEAMKDMYKAAEKWGKEASDDIIKARAESCMASLIEMKLRIEKLPSAQPERKTGQWIKIHWKAYRCSECNRASEYSTDYCPNCGARMKGEADG